VSHRDAYEPGVPCWVSAVVPDAPEAARFYAALFGWETENLMPDDHPGDYIVCRKGGRDAAAVVSQHGAPPPPRPIWAIHVHVDDLDVAIATATEAGGRVVGEPFDSPGGGRQAVIADPAGAVFSVWQPGTRAGAQVVNEPSAWSMSLLSTPDQQGAKEFYGALFGWETDTFEAGGASVTLWRLPGYFGGEPQQPVPRDVVAAMADAPPGAAPHWAVDFWTDDADRTAEKAAELGGSVLAPPYEVPPFRQAAIADPHGTTFTVSQLLL
jgi:predicted enzyme related to lactoylglutathione lyase